MANLVMVGQATTERGFAATGLNSKPVAIPEAKFENGSISPHKSMNSSAGSINSSSYFTKNSFPTVDARNLSEKMSSDLKSMQVKGQQTSLATKTAI